jgi:hypothetical protein
MKKNQSYYYIGDDITNSFKFKISKILDDHIIILTNEGKDINIHRISIDHFNEKMKLKQIKQIKQI